MSSLRLLALLSTCLLGLQLNKSTAQKISVLKTEIFEFVNDYDAYTNTSREIIKPPNSQLVIGDDTSIGSRILLKCSANFPVQWIYLGDGQPEFTTYTNIEWMGTSGSTPLKFSAEASLGLLGFQRILRETDTGNYTCRSIQDPKVLSYYYIFVPGPSLFTRAGGENLTYSYKDSTIRIPCSISDPSTAVTLCKFVHTTLQCPVKDGKYKYDSKKGFLLNLWEQPNPSGTYVCAGSNKKLYRIAKYTLIPTSQPTTKDPCASSPCGYQAECSANSDGTAICYCFRGYNGNPYDQCQDGPAEGSKCYSSDECPASKNCLLGKCVNPCEPSPCGTGSVCEVYGRKARCSCHNGFEGRPPYCKKTCTDNFDCGRNEICSRKFCIDACPGPCGVNAECRVAQRGAQRNTVCSCPVGTTGDPTKRCRAIGGPDITPGKRCPNGYIGKPPYCEPVECDVDEDCPPGKECVSNICRRQETDSIVGGNCGGQCGLNAECKRSLFSKDSKCECVKGYSGDPEIFCSADDSSSGSDSTKPVWEDNPCKPNPCPDYGDCRVVNGKAKCKSDVSLSPAKCPKGFIGKPPKCRPDDDTDEDKVECEFDFECPLAQECVNERCTKGPGGNNSGSSKDEDECEGVCGLNAECKMTPLSAEFEYDCFCKKGYKGNPLVACKPTDSSVTSSLCDPSPCANLAACRVINGQAVCKCPRGFRGDPYIDCTSRGTSSFFQGTTDSPFNRNSYRTTTDSPYNRNSYRTTTESPYNRNSYGTTRRSYGKRDECELDDDSLPYSFAFRIGSGSCGSNEKCEFVNGGKKCVCKTGYSGKPPNCEKYSQGNFRCVDDDDCGQDETCKNFSCVNPCSREPKYPCAPNAECRVVEKNALCSCSRGFIGDPRYRCRPSGRRQPPYASGSSTSTRNLGCDTSGLNCRGSNVEGSCVEGEPLCICKKGYVGYPPNCRLECEKNSHCYKSKVCVRNECVDPCENENACSSHEKCTVLNHVLICVPKVSASNSNPCLNGYRSSRCRYE